MKYFNILFLSFFLIKVSSFSTISSSHLSRFNCKKIERLRFSDSSDPHEFEDTKAESLPSNEGEEIYQIVKKESGNLLNKRRGLNKYERNIKRRKLFLLSTFLEDLLPDPSQGQSKLLNMCVDASKIVKRAAFGLFNTIFELPQSVSVLLVILILLFSFTQYPLDTMFVISSYFHI